MALVRDDPTFWNDKDEEGNPKPVGWQMLLDADEEEEVEEELRSSQHAQSRLRGSHAAKKTAHESARRRGVKRGGRAGV